MDEMSTFWTFILEHKKDLLEQTLEHSGLTFTSLFFAILIGMPLGLWITRKEKLASFILGFTGILQTIPSIALLGFMIPMLGIGPKPAIFALFLYALLPIVRNTYTGVIGVSATIKEAAKGMGMTDMQLLFRVELPLAISVIFAGIRTATVINVGVATLAAYIAAGGLGEFIFGGIALNNTYMILAGAIPAALLAIFFDFILAKLQHLNVTKLRRVGLIFLILLPLISAFYIFPNTTASSLKAGFSPEFIGRQDGYPGLKKTYLLEISNVIIAPALVYKAVYENNVQVIDGYSTDGRIKAYDLVALDDNRSNFPPYYASPLIRNEVIAEYPYLKDLINLLAYKITDSAMTEMNYQVDYLKQAPLQVAANFLKANNLHKPSNQGTEGKIKIGSKIFSEQYILVEMYKIIIEGHSNLQVETITGLGGTKICFDALLAGEIDMYPEYTGTGFQVILNASEATAERLGGNNEDIYKYVDKQFNERYNLDWLEPIGFNNTYSLLMKKEMAKKMQIKSISDLVHHLHR